ncbi:MAG: ABC transporter ATP-binding protein [Eubacteriales bacterium]
MSDILLDVKNLEVSFHTYSGEVKAVRNISFDLKRGETIAIVGESGSGKSVTSKAIMQLIHKPGEIKSTSSIKLEDKELVGLSYNEMRKYRGEQVSMIFQDALASLNPTRRIGQQVAESLIIHHGVPKKEALLQAVEMLRLVKVPDPERRARQYPHEFSGGMRQRAMIAMALINKPKVLIADEPTTALDVTVQAQIMELIADMKEEIGTSVILITHDLGVVAGAAARVFVMYGGKIVESGSTEEIFYNPKHPYTWALLNSVPRLNIAHKEELYSIKGTPPDLLTPPAGCPFAPRCDHRMSICNRLLPEEFEISQGHTSSCWLSHEKAPVVDVFQKLEVQ